MRTTSMVQDFKRLKQQKRTILIVDDSPTNLGVLTDYLKGFGFKILISRDGETALKRVEMVNPDIILLDIMMPGMDGFEVCSRLKANHIGKDIPVIFMSSLSDANSKMQASAVGGVDYVTKPFYAEDILTRIRTHLKIRELAKSLGEQNERLHKMADELLTANSVLSKRAIQLEASNQVGQQLTSILNLDEMLINIVKSIQSQFGYYFVGIWLLNAKKDKLILEAGIGIDEKPLLKSGFQVSMTVASSIITVCETGESYLTNDTGKIKEGIFKETLHETRSKLVLPLKVGQETMGVLDIESNQLDAFDREDRIAMQTLANQITIAIRNAQLYKTEEERARTLAELNANKDKFFSIVAHDLINPFQPLLGNAEFLAKYCHKLSNNEIEDSANDIYKSAKQALELLQNLLSWARLQMGRMKPTFEDIDLHVLSNDTVDLLQDLAANKNIFLHSFVRKNTIIHADENMLKTIIRNLITNAIKFTPNEGRVTIEAVPSSTNVKTIEIHVSDTGIGISHENIRKLFKIDVHHSTKGTASEQGTGLGLIICQEMVHKNDGDIWVESEQDKGTTVKFTVLRGSTIIKDTAGLATTEPENIEQEEEYIISKSGKLVSPPLAEMKILHEMATMGDIEGIKVRITTLAEKNSKYISFADTLRTLAAQFEEDKILTLVEKYME